MRRHGVKPIYIHKCIPIIACPVVKTGGIDLVTANPPVITTRDVMWATIDSQDIHVIKDVIAGLNELEHWAVHYLPSLTHLWSCVFKWWMIYPRSCVYIRFKYCQWRQNFYTWPGKWTPLLNDTAPGLLLLRRADLSLWCRRDSLG